MDADKTEMEHDIRVKEERKEKKGEKEGEGGVEKEREDRISLCFSFDQRTSRSYVVRKDAAGSRGGRIDGERCG